MRSNKDRSPKSETPTRERERFVVSGMGKKSNSTSQLSATGMFVNQLPIFVSKLIFSYQFLLNSIRGFCYFMSNFELPVNITRIFNWSFKKCKWYY